MVEARGAGVERDGVREKERRGNRMNGARGRGGGWDAEYNGS